MRIKVFIFYGDGAFLNIKGNISHSDGSAFVLGIDFKEEFAVAIENLGTDGGRSFGKFGGVGDVFKKKDKINKEKTDKDGNNRENSGTTSFGAFPIAFFDGVEKLFSSESHSDYIIPAMIRWRGETTLVLLYISDFDLGKFSLFCAVTGGNRRAVV